jgi:hypothetical protein
LSDQDLFGKGSGVVLSKEQEFLMLWSGQQQNIQTPVLIQIVDFGI